MIKVNLQSAGKTVFSLHQLDSRYFKLPKENISFSSTRFDPKEDPGVPHSYSYFRVLIGKVQTVNNKTPKKKRLFNMFDSVESVQSVTETGDNPGSIISNINCRKFNKPKLNIQIYKL